MATLRTAALDGLRLAGFQSIRSGMQTIKDDITALLAMAKRQPQPSTSRELESALAFGGLIAATTLNMLGDRCTWLGAYNLASAVTSYTKIKFDSIAF